jgi:hypothetical protein
VKTKVILIGGAPGTGKTTLGTALAARLDTTSLSIDDLLTAAMAVTTPESHPGLHFKKGVPFQEYFTNSSLEQLKTDATLQHETAWPMVKRKNANWLRGSSDPEKMLENFLARSLWYNELIREQATELQMNILLQDGERTVEELSQQIMDTLI